MCRCYQKSIFIVNNVICNIVSYFYWFYWLKESLEYVQLLWFEQHCILSCQYACPEFLNVISPIVISHRCMYVGEHVDIIFKKNTRVFSVFEVVIYVVYCVSRSTTSRTSLILTSVAYHLFIYQ